jgi:hypothetical protein
MKEQATFNDLAVQLVGEENATLFLVACTVVGLAFLAFLYFLDRERSAAFQRKQLVQKAQRSFEIEHITLS